MCSSMSWSRAPSLPCQTTSASATAPAAVSRTGMSWRSKPAVDDRAAGDVPGAGPPADVGQRGLNVGSRERRSEGRARSSSFEVTVNPPWCSRRCPWSGRRPWRRPAERFVRTRVQLSSGICGGRDQTAGCVECRSVFLRVEMGGGGRVNGDPRGLAAERAQGSARGGTGPRGPRSRGRSDGRRRGLRALRSRRRNRSGCDCRRRVRGRPTRP